MRLIIDCLLIVVVKNAHCVDGRYLVKVGPGYVQSDSGPFVLDLGAILNRAMTGAKAGGVARLVK